jgi:D-arabinose 1-dehydrogenase-like Zn-dependent alcohol dehydrogenase
MTKMRAVQASRPHGPLELVERDIPEPPPGWVRIKVQACGICHSDSFTVEGAFPGIQYPRVPGHEVAGVIDKVASDVKNYKVGQRVGVGWYAGHCGICKRCRRGDFITCEKLQISGISHDGGYADYMITPSSGLALIPDDLNAIEAAPLLCAGITTFNALRNSGAQAGEVVAILGVGGLGHLGVQFAAKMGFYTVGIARGSEKEAFVKSLGAKKYIDNLTHDVAKELDALGGAKVILSTVTESKAVNAAVDGLAVNGKLIVVGAASGQIEASPIALIRGRRCVCGWPSGTSIDSQDTLAFSAMAGVRSMNETYPLEKAKDAYERMMSGKARFRVVLVTGN